MIEKTEQDVWLCKCQGFNGTMKFSCYPDLLVRTNSTVEELSVAFSVGAAGGLLIPFIAVIADK